MDETVESVGRGRYRLVRSVGRGGMAAVYQATDTALGREVAVKLMDRTATGEDFRRRFRREARAVAALNHRNVIAIHDIGEEPVHGGDPTPYLVMEFVHGRPLSEVVSTGPTAVPEALRIAADILDGLAASHDAGLVHRDIKPANVMVARDGTVKVLDFGIARSAAADTAPVTRTGTVMGTAPYMSPEQAQGRELDHRSDLYSTGILLFELLSGRRPFDAGAEAALLYHHVHTPPPLLSDLGITVPGPVQDLVSRALEKDPARRPATARQMRSLVLAAARTTVPLRPTTAPRPLGPAIAPRPHVPAPPPFPPTAPAPGGALPPDWPLRASLAAAPVGHLAGWLTFSHLLTPLYRSGTSGTVGLGGALAYAVMYAPILLGLLTAIRRTRTTPPDPHRPLAVACITVNGLWAFYHLGTWLFAFPLFPV